LVRAVLNARLKLARTLALLVPAALLGGALISQYQFGLAPCQMCHWQRWPHYAALLPALVAFSTAHPWRVRVLVLIAALLIAVSGAIGVFHAGVEYGWWDGLTACATNDGRMTVEDMLAAPVIRCDVAPWTLFGISLAGFNALLSLGGAALIAIFARTGRMAR
jgi:disulfide bond formation protein DsbB